MIEEGWWVKTCSCIFRQVNDWNYCIWKPNTSQRRKFIIQSWSDFGLARSFCNLTYVLTSPFAYEPNEIHTDQEYRATEVVMGKKEMGRPGEQSYKRDHMPLLANVILENSQPLNAMITLSYCWIREIVITSLNKLFSSTQNTWESNFEKDWGHAI